MRRRCLVTVPMLGTIPDAFSPVNCVLAQSKYADLVVVDNGGGYRARGREEVVNVGNNIGWAAASNLGFRLAFARGYTHAVTLNSDTRLSPDFFHGLLDARLPLDMGMVGPMYDEDGINNGWKTQSSNHRSHASRYTPSPYVRRVQALDGTCLCIPRHAWERVGCLDERSFGRFSWGADIDLAIRMQTAGFGVYVTEMSFMNHYGRLSATKLVGERAYVKRANRDLHAGMRKLHGRKAYRRAKGSGYTRMRLPQGDAHADSPSTGPQSLLDRNEE